MQQPHTTKKETYFMGYENKSRTELINIINDRNRIIEILENRIAKTDEKLNQLTHEGIVDLVKSLNEQSKIQNDLISQLRYAKAELLELMKQK